MLSQSYHFEFMKSKIKQPGLTKHRKDSRAVFKFTVCGSVVRKKCHILIAVVLVVQRFCLGLVIERSLVRLPAGALLSQLGQLSLPSLRGR